MDPESRISATFSRLQSSGHMAFMPFITAGDPDMATTTAIIRGLAECGVDLIEIGFPYSDPIADGPVIQESYTRALNNGLRVNEILAAVASLKRDSAAAQIPPLVAMVSYAIVFRHGIEQFVNEARDAGFSGLIIPDLPGDEADEFFGLTQTAGLDLVQLIAPTTPPHRVARIVRTCSGFLYCISVAGTTGVRTELPDELAAQLQSLRSRTKLPLAVGFGISRPEQVDALRDVADGVIVGSAIVRLAANAGSSDAAVASVNELAEKMVAATHRSR